MLRDINVPFFGDNSDKFIWALKDVSFDIKHGERLGIIGRNGAGKTTLLKILSRLVSPTEGEAVIRGKVTSLLGVGTGFNVNLTGRENIYLNASLYGLTKAEINDKFDEIVEFSGVMKFIDTPVKYYSSGMHSRLAFSIAAHLEPDILMLDEVLSVGDMAFQQKCLKKVEGLTAGNRTILFVSHSMGSILQFCNRVIWLDNGKIKYDGNASEGCAFYLEEMCPVATDGRINNNLSRKGTGIFQFNKFSITDTSGNPRQVVQTGEDFDIVLEYEQKEDMPKEIWDVQVGITIFTEKDQRLISMQSEVVDANINNLRNKGKIICHIKRLPLVPDIYYANISLQVNRQLVEKVQRGIRLMVIEGDFYSTGKLPLKNYAPVCIDYEWETT